MARCLFHRFFWDFSSVPCPQYAEFQSTCDSNTQTFFSPLNYLPALSLFFSIFIALLCALFIPAFLFLFLYLLSLGSLHFSLSLCLSLSDMPRRGTLLHQVHERERRQWPARVGGLEGLRQYDAVPGGKFTSVFIFFSFSHAFSLVLPLFLYLSLYAFSISPSPSISPYRSFSLSQLEHWHCVYI